MKEKMRKRDLVVYGILILIMGFGIGMAIGGSIASNDNEIKQLITPNYTKNYGSNYNPDDNSFTITMPTITPTEPTITESEFIKELVDGLSSAKKIDIKIETENGNVNFYYEAK